VGRTKLFAALACAFLVLVLGLLGCGAFQGQTNYLQSIQLNVTLINGQSASGLVINLDGAGATIQLQAIGTYNDKKTRDLTNKVTYIAIVDPDLPGNLLPPCQAPDCPVPAQPPYTSGTLEYSPTGLITAVDPAACTWDNSGTQQSPIWSISADYIVTASFEGITSQPVFIPVGSAAYPGGGSCGPL